MGASRRDARSGFTDAEEIVMQLVGKEAVPPAGVSTGFLTVASLKGKRRDNLEGLP